LASRVESVAAKQQTTEVALQVNGSRRYQHPAPAEKTRTQPTAAVTTP